ncbi:MULTISPECIES: DUF4250 domain-containing protein [unclassified Agarivorans]|uniref:DUF4250 domain-containing protein n=1 Tax=unclassified Agarivorans TaxID=2636026 RepID=UPI003D7DFD53
MLDQQRIETMDVHILLSIVNMQIRNDFGSFSELCQFYALDQDKLTQRLQQAGYELRAQQQQFIVS